MSRMKHVLAEALVGAALALSVAVPLGAAAQGMPTDVIYNFTGGAEGDSPNAGLIRDAAGNFYGVTSLGGNSNCTSGCGAVFKLSPLGVVTVLHGFTGSDGGQPDGKLIADAAGNLYGTTSVGGAHGLGVVFKLTPDGQETVLYSFAGGSDGAEPVSGLVEDAAGNFYGTTDLGGPSNLGTVFRLAPDGTETVLHAFSGGGGGESFPASGVVMDKAGNLYGIASIGGRTSGKIFKIAPDGEYSVLYSFSGGAGGGDPRGDLLLDKQGNLYGTTYRGGLCYSCGVVFKLAPDGAETVLHNFTDVASEPNGGLIMDQQGNLFGTTSGGGSFGEGTVFQLSPDGTLTVLHSFAGQRDSPPDGQQPAGNLILHMNKLYGTTERGGSGCTFGCGTLFEVRKAK